MYDYNYMQCTRLTTSPGLVKQVALTGWASKLKHKANNMSIHVTKQKLCNELDYAM